MPDDVIKSKNTAMDLIIGMLVELYGARRAHAGWLGQLGENFS
jgi:hypothetical protein